MARTTLILLLIAAPIGAAPIKPRGTPDGPSELEGKWVVVAVTVNAIDTENMVGTTFVIQGDKFTVQKPEPGSQGRIKVDKSTNPKRVEFEVHASDGKPNGKAGRWIYELDGDELRMASFTDSDGAIPEKIDPTVRKQLIWRAKRVKD
jgi:uncharacterized protein (TIGR03067 family)